MRYGLFISFQVPLSGEIRPDVPYREMLEYLPYAEELGYSTVLVASHHVQPNPWCPSPLVALGAAAALTKRMRLGTGVLLVPLYAPLKLAEDVAVLDNLSGGRFVFGVAPGYVSEEFVAHGVPREERVPRLEEALDLMTAAWTQHIASFDGQFYRLPPSSVTPKPLQNPHPPIWYGVSGKRSIRNAARRRAVLTASPRHGLAELREHFDLYEAAAAEVGFEIPERPVIRGLFLAETTKEAETIAGPAITALFRELYAAKSAQGERVLRTDSGDVITDASTVGFEQFKNRYIIGDPDFARQEIARYRDEIGATEIIAWTHLPGIPLEHTTRSLELFARDVMGSA
jgi:alkanesulfonate monooxygenase SsuD/methylene tetrahydromethanopterin reductase-like flavin-dependent oxidoreductase (luciferase family)